MKREPMLKKIVSLLAVAFALIAGSLTVASPALATTCSPACFYYAGGQATPGHASGTTGVYAAFDIAKPTVSTANGDGHSLAEMSVESADGNQIVEAGWTVDPILNGDSNPHLFVFRWINGIHQGYNLSGGFHACGPTNPSCTTAPTVGVGQSVNGDVGTLKTFGIEYFSSVWWVSYNSQWLGFYTGSDWSSPTFTVVDWTQVFGEVASTHDLAASPSSAPCAQMGNGLQSSSTSSARIGSLTYIGGTAAPSLTAFSGPYANYTAALISPSVRSLRYGGDNTSC